MTDFTPDDRVAARTLVRKVVARYIRNTDDAEDVTQDALLRAHRHHHAFNGESKYSTWLYRVAVTTALDHLRRAGRRPVTTCEEDAPEAVSGDDPRERMVVADQAARARAAVAAMGALYPTVFERRYGDGMSEGEVAEELGLPLATVRARAHRSRVVALTALLRAA